jgi:hypothetical protein
MDDVVAALRKSGFPLQIRVEHEIQKRRLSGWVVLEAEYPWRDADGCDQFMDLVASCGSVVSVIECKKAAERSLLFLRPLGSETTGAVTDAAFWHVTQNRGAGTSFGMKVVTMKIEPSSFQAAICVASEKRLLEHEARPVVMAADAYAHAISSASVRGVPNPSYVVPSIVTSASLYTLGYEPPEIALETGEFKEKLDVSRIEEVPWIRFHKVFTAQPGSQARTVLVVNAAHLPQYLDEIARWPGFNTLRS